MDIEKFIKKSNDMFSSYMKRYIKNRTVLDIGCGNGLSALFLAEEIPCKMELTDIEDLRDKKARTLPFRLASKSKIPYENDSFDVLLIQMILHHLKTNPVAFLREAYRVTKEHVILVEEVLTEGIDIKEAMRMDREVNEKLHPGFSSPVQRFFSEEELKQFIRRAKLKIEKEHIIPVKNYLSFKVFILKKSARGN